MLLYLNHFKFDCNEVFGNIHDYIDRKEENKQVLIQKMIAKKSGKVIESNTSAIWLILESARL